jgi:ADP-ribosyl-[dinitrogen reductase] hydrolase
LLQLIERVPQPWRGAIKGALIGDALGVPHEFKPAHLIPGFSEIQMVMPPGYRKTYEAIRYGRWSDDGSQLLALLDALVRTGGRYDELLFLDNMLAWLRAGKFQAGGQVFDMGAQTRYALERRESGQDLDWGFPSGRCGNGSLMRVLPAAVMRDIFCIPEEDVIEIGMRQSDLTHPQPLARACCALYIETCFGLVRHPEALLPVLVQEAAERLRGRSSFGQGEMGALATVMDFGARELPTGSGYVVNTLWSAIWAVSCSTSLSDALRTAIGLGNDTDTVASLTGGLAGLRFGVDELSSVWWGQMDLRTPLCPNRIEAGEEARSESPGRELKRSSSEAIPSGAPSLPVWPVQKDRAAAPMALIPRPIRRHARSPG